MGKHLKSTFIHYVANNKQLASCFILLSAGFMYCNYPVVSSLVHSWRNNNTYTYGFLIPLISLYVVWAKRDSLAGIEARPCNATGLLLFIGSISMLVIGKWGELVVLKELSILLIIPSMVLLFLGTEYLRRLAFPILYLVFMLPIWDVFIDGLHYRLQLLSANIGAHLISLLGIPVVHNGITLELPRVAIGVERSCSGVNFQIAVVAIGIPVAYLFLRSWWRRVVLVLGAILIAMLGNGVRVALIGIFSYLGYDGEIHGPYHMLYGYFVSVLGFIALFFGVILLGRGQERDAPGPVPPSSFRHGFDVRDPMVSLKYRMVCLSVLFFLFGTYVNYYQQRPVYLKTSMQRFPHTVKEWVGKDHSVLYKGFGNSGVDAYISRMYRSKGRADHYLYIGYYYFQDQGKEIVNYKVDDITARANLREIDLGGYLSIEVGESDMEFDKGKRKVYYWFYINGRNTANPYKAKIYTIIDSVMHRRNNAAVIVVIRDGESGSPEEADRERQDFITDFFESIEKHLETA